MVGALLVPAYTPFGSVLNSFLFGLLVFGKVLLDILHFFTCL